MEDKFKVDKEVPHNILPANYSSSEQEHDPFREERPCRTKEKESNWNTPYKTSPYDWISYPQPLKKLNQENQIIKFLEVSKMMQTNIPSVKVLQQSCSYVRLRKEKEGIKILDPDIT